MIFQAPYPASGGSSLYFLKDTFTGSGTLDARTPETGSAWGANSDNNQFTLSGGLITSSGNIRVATNPTVPSSADYFVEVIGTLGGGSTNNRIGGKLRGGHGSWPSPFGYIAYINGGGQIIMYRYDGPSGNQYIATATVSVSTSTKYTFRSTVKTLSGNVVQIEFYIDGVKRLTGQDSSSGAYLTAGFAGFYTRDAVQTIDEVRAGAL